MTATLVVEIGVEELPPAAMRPLADDFARGLADALSAAGVAHGAVTRYATPRRLAVSLADTAAGTAARTVEKTGPTIAIAFDDSGRPTAAAEGFARSLGATIDALEREDGPKGERLVYRATEAGQPLGAVLQAAVNSALAGLPIPRRMRWGTVEHAFVRPVHWVVALHGSEIVPLEVFGVAAGRLTRGHRFHGPETLAIRQADDYAQVLEDTGHVLADPDARAARISEQIDVAAQELGGRVLVNDELVAEVTALVEWPVALAGRFDPRFLVLPREVLIATLEGHQRYFPVTGADDALIAGFVTVANLASRDPAQVVAGNERVIRPRLADALFFWNEDRRHGLEAHIEGLARVSFQQSLGTLGEKSARIRELACGLAPATGAATVVVERAAALAKTDLLTEMVGEFPELQGVIGGYYARDAGESAAVAQALAEQYRPAGAGAAIAATPAGRALALADRLDTLAGIFAIDKRPSGDRDPFALRRAALGVIRTLIEGEIDIDLRAVIARAVAIQPVTAKDDTLDALWMFHVERLRGYTADLGIAPEAFESVAALDISNLLDFERRLAAVTHFCQRPEAAAVGNAHKRVRNILRRNPRDDTARLRPEQLQDAAEQRLVREMIAVQKTYPPLMAARDYESALGSLATLAEPLAVFFEEVRVITDDAALRQNRLALLRELDVICRQVADLSFLSTLN